MRQTKIKQNVKIVDGNQLIGKVVDEKDPFVDTCLELIDNLPDSKDYDRVIALKKKIDAGDYNFDENLDKVVDALITESKDPDTISYPLFERWFRLCHMG